MFEARACDTAQDPVLVTRRTPTEARNSNSQTPAPITPRSKRAEKIHQLRQELQTLTTQYKAAAERGPGSKTHSLLIHLDLTCSS